MEISQIRTKRWMIRNVLLHFTHLSGVSQERGWCDRIQRCIWECWSCLGTHFDIIGYLVSKPRCSLFVVASVMCILYSKCIYKVYVICSLKTFSREHKSNPKWKWIEFKCYPIMRRPLYFKDITLHPVHIDFYTYFFKSQYLLSPPQNKHQS